MNTSLVIRVIIFLIVVPGTVTILVPYLVLSSGSNAVFLHDWDLRYFGFIPILFGAIVVLRCIWDFLTAGKGTPAPIDPPKELVITGFYRFVRNPMYIGVFSVLVGEALLFGSLRLLLFAIGFAVFVHFFVILYEEPTLRRKFGSSYEQYCRSISRWIPRLK